MTATCPDCGRPHAMPDCTPMFPNVVVSLDLNGPQGNAYAIMGAVSDGLRQIGVDKCFIAKYIEDSTSSDYDHLLKTAEKWVTFRRVEMPPSVMILP